MTSDRAHRAQDREARSAGEIHVRVPSLGHLFDPIDPSPLSRKDLQPRVEEFIVSWGRELSATRPPIVVHVDNPPDEHAAHAAAEGVRAFFADRALASRRELRHLFRVGRVSLVIALGVLGLSFAVGQLLQSMASPVAFAVGGTLEIGGWVAMWRPLQIFLYDWWPIRSDMRLLQELARTDVRVVCDRSPRDDSPHEGSIRGSGAQPAPSLPLVGRPTHERHDGRDIRRRRGVYDAAVHEHRVRGHAGERA